MYVIIVKKGYIMGTMKERAKERRKHITFSKVNLHSNEHHSFHFDLDSKDSWELLARISQECWKEETGQLPSSRVDKSIYRFISGRSVA